MKHRIVGEPVIAPCGPIPKTPRTTPSPQPEKSLKRVYQPHINYTKTNYGILTDSEDSDSDSDSEDQDDQEFIPWKENQIKKENKEKTFKIAQGLGDTDSESEFWQDEREETRKQHKMIRRAKMRKSVKLGRTTDGTEWNFCEEDLVYKNKIWARIQITSKKEKMYAGQKSAEAMEKQGKGEPLTGGDKKMDTATGRLYVNQGLRVYMG